MLIYQRVSFAITWSQTNEVKLEVFACQELAMLSREIPEVALSCTHGEFTANLQYSNIWPERSGEDVSLNSEILGKIYKPDVREQTEQTSGLKCLGVNQNEVRQPQCPQ